MPKLRERARQEYLRKREEDKLVLLEEEIRDEEALFRDEVMTEKERRNLEYKKEVLRLAKAKQAAVEVRQARL